MRQIITAGHRWSAWLMVLIPLASVGPVLADDATAKVNQVKAAFIYNIAKFVTWQDADLQQEVFNVCFYRHEFIGKGFSSIAGQEVHGKVVIKSVVPDLQHVGDCQILLLSADEMPHYQLEFKEAQAMTGLLTIADLTTDRGQGRLHPGVLLSLIRRGNNIGFEVSLQQVKARQLIMSSQLLKLAHILDEES